MCTLKMLESVVVYVMIDVVNVMIDCGNVIHGRNICTIFGVSTVVAPLV